MIIQRTGHTGTVGGGCCLQGQGGLRAAAQQRQNRGEGVWRVHHGAPGQLQLQRFPQTRRALQAYRGGGAARAGRGSPGSEHRDMRGQLLQL
jgi:hypothetical protein